LYTYGSPRVLNKKLADWMAVQSSEYFGLNYRLTHLNDPIPQVPPTWFGYQHLGPEYYIDTGNAEPVAASNISVLAGGENPEGNAQWFLMDTEAHIWYLSRISACYDGPPIDWSWFSQPAPSTPEESWLNSILEQLSGFIPAPPKEIPLLPVSQNRPPPVGKSPRFLNTDESSSPIPGGASLDRSPVRSSPGREEEKRKRKKMLAKRSLLAVGTPSSGSVHPKFQMRMSFVE